MVGSGKQRNGFMNIDDIEKSLCLRREWCGDEEYAHIEEDRLFHAFVESISKGTFEGDISDGAKKVMSALDIEYCRWHA